jgi:hypothetical protein
VATPPHLGRGEFDKSAALPFQSWSARLTANGSGRTYRLGRAKEIGLMPKNIHRVVVGRWATTLKVFGIVGLVIACGLASQAISSASPTQQRSWRASVTPAVGDANVGFASRHPGRALVAERALTTR